MKKKKNQSANKNMLFGRQKHEEQSANVTAFSGTGLADFVQKGTDPSAVLPPSQRVMGLNGLVYD